MDALQSQAVTIRLNLSNREMSAARIKRPINIEVTHMNTSEDQKDVASPNDPKLSDCGGWQPVCGDMAGGEGGGSIQDDSRSSSLQRMVRRLCVDVYKSNGAEVSVLGIYENDKIVFRIGDEQFTTCDDQLRRVRDWLTILLSGYYKP
jgi:hypothetical protein